MPDSSSPSMSPGPAGTPTEPARESILDDLIASVALTRDPFQVRRSVLRLVRTVTGNGNVWIDGDARSPWDVGRADAQGTTGFTEEEEAAADLSIPMVCGGRQLGLLRIEAEGRREWPASMLQRLRTLATLAATAELALTALDMARPGADVDSAPGTFLGAFLQYTLAQAHRRREPLSILHIALDRQEAIRELLGPEAVEAAIRRVNQAVVSKLRASDLVARSAELIVAALPGASSRDAIRVAESLRSLIEQSGIPSPGRPVITASIGVAGYPDHALDLPTLRAAAQQALLVAQGQGHNRVSAIRPVFQLAPMATG